MGITKKKKIYDSYSTCDYSVLNIRAVDYFTGQKFTGIIILIVTMYHFHSFVPSPLDFLSSE